MKYYLIAGEASGDLHAANLMRAIRECDPQAEFRFWGGDAMPSASLEKYNFVQERFGSLSSRCPDFGRLSRLQLENSPLCQRAVASAGALLHIAEDLGMERVSYQGH